MDPEAPATNRRDPRMQSAGAHPMNPAFQQQQAQPRYVPPTGRYTPMATGQSIERPESTASNASFQSQAGGVSLYDVSFNQGLSMLPSGNYSYNDNRSYSDGSDPFITGPPSTQGYHQTGGFGHMNNYGQQGMYAQQGNPGYGYALSSPPNAMYSHAQPTMAPAQTQQSQNAARMASIIKSGQCDIPDNGDAYGPASSRGRSHARRGSRAAATPAYGHTRTPSISQPSRTHNDGQWLLQQPSSPMTTQSRPVENVIPPAWLNNYKPSLTEAMESLPFHNPLVGLQKCTYGVICIKNMPYGTKKAEIISVLGRHAQLVTQPPGSPFFAVHVVLERHTGKTMDAFVEVARPQEAIAIYNQFARRTASGRNLKLGDRPVDVELSSQEELMRELFPRAKNVQWDGNTPIVHHDDTEYYPGVRAQGFNGFLGNEEMAMLMKYIETPQRSPFVQRCPQRVHEAVITVLAKYPWHAPHTNLISDRKKIYDATVLSVRTLAMACRRGSHTDLNPTLLQELATTSLACPGLSEHQKSAIVGQLVSHSYGNYAFGQGVAVRLGGAHSLSRFWPFNVLARKPEASDDLLGYYVNMIREVTAGTATMSLGQMAAMLSQNMAQNPFGRVMIDYGSDDIGHLSLSEVAEKEFEALADFISSELTTGGNSNYRSSGD